ncbi:MAG: ABC transporter permease [Bacteroidia bacterium]
MIFKLAWRNIWRNKRRTGITLASIFFAVVLSSLMMSLKEGVYTNMIESGAGAFGGYAQIHANGYWEEKTIDNSFELTDSMLQKLENKSALEAALPRIESFSLAIGNDVTKGSAVFGIDVEKEAEFHGLKERIDTGAYLTHNDDGVLLGSGLAKYLHLQVGDSIILLGSGYHGMTAAGKYIVRGLVNFGSPELSKQVVFMTLEQAHIFFGTDGLINNLVLKTEFEYEGTELAKSLKLEFDSRYEVMDWQELNPQLVNMIESDRVEGYVFMFILYMVISFGIFGTMLMMLTERKREFGVLIAVGMKRAKLATMVFIEVVSISILGSFLGIFGALPISYNFYKNPIPLTGEMTEMMEDYGMEAVLQASIAPSVFIQQSIVVAIVAIIISLYPFFKLRRIRAIDEMRG